MDIREYAKKHYPNVRIATRDDNERVLAFYRKLSMLGGAFNIQFTKDPDYFRFLDYECKDHYVILVEDDDANIEGMFSVALRPCYIDGKVSRVAHVSDLRFTRRRDRKTTLDWKDIANDIVGNHAAIDQFDGCSIFLGSFILANDFARKAFTSLKTPFAISNIATYKMVNIIARKPLKWAGLRKRAQDAAVSVSRGTEADRDALRTFLDGESKRRQLGFVYAGTDGELDRRLAVWDGFSMSDFFVARDKSGAIIGCFGVWDHSHGRKIVVDGFPMGLGAAAKVVKRLGKNVPTPGDSIAVLYLTTLEFSHTLDEATRATAFGAMLDALYESGIVEKFHLVAYCDYDNESLLSAVEPAYFTQQTPTLLYQMHNHEVKAAFREEELTCHAGHEMSLT